MRAPSIERHVHGRRRALAAQRRGGRLEHLAQLPRQDPLGVGDAPHRRRALRQALEHELCAAQAIAHTQLGVVALRGQRRALTDRQPVRPRQGKRVAYGLGERVGCRVRPLAGPSDAPRERLDRVGERPA